MKTRTINKNTWNWIGMLTLLIGALFTGCTGEENLDGTIAQEESLNISPQVIEAKTRTASDVSLNESLLTKLDVKLFGKDDEQIRLSKQLSQLSNGTTALLDQGNWKDRNDLVEGKTYQILAIANATANLQGTNTLEDLSQCVQTDADIWKPYHATSNKGKTFLMSSATDYQITSSATQTIQASLSRAAAKILVKLSIAVPGYTVGQPTWSFKNYNTKTTLFGEANTETFFGDNTAKALGNMGDSYESMQGSDGNFTITTYSYATSWKDTPEETPTITVKVPLTKVDESAEGEGQVGETINNFYSIPVRETSETELRRNYLYMVNANITNLGSSTEINYGTPVDLKYDVMKWAEGEETIINADKQSYLLVSPTFHIMRNETVDNKTIHFYASDACTVKIDEVYYYDKNGTKQKITSGKLYPQINLKFADGHTEKKDQGLVNIEAGEFVPLTVKFIKFTITSGNKSQQVTVKQYPLEYIQAIDGWYSTKDLDGWIDWKTHQESHDSWKKSSDDNFQAKVYTYGSVGGGIFGGGTKGTYIWEYDDARSNGKYKATLSSAQTEKSNNHMYVVQITQANDNYTIGHVNNIDANTKLSLEDVVSPAFALASQLGTVTAFGNGVNASKHCDDYVEVGLDGKRYDNWRLPTESEINVIVSYQYDKNQDVVTEVLRGGSYWALSGKQVKANSSNRNGGYVRCVRDLSPEEVTALENKNE